jgi:CRP/FNR family transcriptional regulator, cyclic AMP receptor protein
VPIRHTAWRPDRNTPSSWSSAIVVAYGRRGPAGVVVDVRLTQAELATMCGAAEVSTQKALRELRVAGLVGTGYREIVIHDVPGLRTAAELP